MFLLNYATKVSLTNHVYMGLHCSFFTRCEENCRVVTTLGTVYREVGDPR